MSSDAEIVEANAALMRREIMGRLASVEHELDQIDGACDDLPERDEEIDERLADAKRATTALQDLLVERGWR